MTAAVEARPTGAPQRLALVALAAAALLAAHVAGAAALTPRVAASGGRVLASYLTLGLVAQVALIWLGLGRGRDRLFQSLGVATSVAVYLQLVIGFTLRAASLALAQPLHWALAGLGGALLAAWAAEAWRRRAANPAAGVGAVVTAALYLAEAAVGLAIRRADASPGLAGLHLATAALVWGALIATQGLTTLGEGGAALAGRRAGSWKDYLALTKPVIVALLLVTTLSGMIVGAHGWPGGARVFWTLLGGALSAGGASALNQFIDRRQDGRMQRTQGRPLPAGRLTPAEALAFGGMLCIAGFYLLALAVNLLSALLSLAGMVYYAVIYSLVLKQTTPQNIVVGGGAGAIPPLVGWAAVTGSLSMSAFLLFAVVFFWTPPHFWALALVRRNDYARAGVPMLPVVHGEREARWQILLYTLQLVALTLMLPLAGDGGWFYLAAAAALGLGFLGYAWRLWRQGGNRLAWGLYRYSSVYLALIFAALVVDTLGRG